MTKQTQQNLKNHIVNHAMQWIEENGGDKNDISDVLCELSKEIRSGDGPIFTSLKNSAQEIESLQYEVVYFEKPVNPLTHIECLIGLQRNEKTNVTLFGSGVYQFLSESRDRLKALEIFLDNKR